MSKNNKTITNSQIERYSPDDEKKIRRHLKTFERFLFDRGGEVLAPASEWELVRFETSNGLGIIYRKNNGQVTFYGAARLAWSCYLTGSRWTAGNKRKRARGKQRIVIDSLAKRDGHNCFYCGCKCIDENSSVEHLVPLNSGGTDHMSNKVLACVSCNREAGHMPVIEKIKLRERKLHGLHAGQH